MEWQLLAVWSCPVFLDHSMKLTSAFWRKAAVQKTLSAGLGYHWGENNSLLGLGFNWGQPNEDTFGPGLDDQYTVELFSRLQVLRNLQITPDIQYIRNPARNTEASSSWVFGIRARLYF